MEADQGRALRGDSEYNGGEKDEQPSRHEGDGSADRRVGSAGGQSSAPEILRSSSSVGGASLRSPSSPNPSFNSLQARPTPPATSGRSSPSPSMLSNLPQDRTQGAGTLTSRPDSIKESAERNDDMTHERNDNQSALSEQDPLAGGFGQKKGPRTSPDGRDAGEAKQFFPEALLKDERGIAPLGIDVVRDTNRPAMGSTESEADSDRYGQPSPREGSAERTTATPFAAGYGEVPYGLQGGDQERSLLSESQDPETAPPTSAASTEVKDKKPYFQVRVGDPQKVGDPVTAHIVYTVRIKTDSQLFKSTTFSVLRRYSDFRWLHAALVHNNPGIFIPPVPEKVRSGRFAPDLVEARRHGLESCVNKIANNAILQLDEDFRLFLESQNFHADVKARDQVKGPVPTPEQKSYFGWSTSFTGTTYRYREQDEWFEEQKVYLDHLEMHLKSLVRIVSTLAQQRKDVALATSESSHALMMLSGSSLSRSLSTCFAGLGEVQRRTFELADTQADADIREFGSVLYEFERMVGSARKAFATRLDAWQTWQRLEDETKKVRVKHEKVKKDMQPGSHKAHDGGRLQAVLDELATAETRCLNAKREFDIIGRRCKEQMDLFEGDRIDTFHEACEIWLQGMIERNQEIMAEWEQYASLLERQTGQKVI